MCGITGILKKKKRHHLHEQEKIATKSSNVDLHSVDLAFLSLEQLQNRGYDSLGVGTIHHGTICTEKTCTLTDKEFTRISNIVKERENGTEPSLIIGHTRWATHGGRNVRNAHPHTSNSGLVSLVHNGINENYLELKSELVQTDAYQMHSETDTEVIANLVEKQFKHIHTSPLPSSLPSSSNTTTTSSDESEVEGCHTNEIEYRQRIDDAIESIEAVIHQLKGTYGLVVIFSFLPQTLFLVKHGSPLLFGENEDAFMATSEVAGFCGQITHYNSMKPRQVVALDAHLGILTHRYSCNHTLNNFPNPPNPPNSPKLLLPDSTIPRNQEVVAKPLNPFQTHAIDNSVLNESLSLPTHFNHWTQKEIVEQHKTLMQSINYGARIYNDHVHLGGLKIIEPFIQNIRHVVLIACGTSLYASQCATHYFRLIPSIETTSVFDGAEFEIDMLPKSYSNTSAPSTCNSSVTSITEIASCLPNTLVFLCSQSGETMDLIRCLHLLESNKSRCFTIGIVNVVDSQIARNVDCGIYMNAGREVSVASTKAFLSALIVYYMASQWIQSKWIESKTNSSILPIHMSKRVVSIRDAIQSIYDMQHSEPIENQTAFSCLVKSIESITSTLQPNHRLESSHLGKSLFVLGRGKLAHIAKECALKFKEMCYIHAEGCHSGSLKHGPFALLEPNFPVILLIDNENKEKLMNTYQELKSRDAAVFIVTDTNLHNQIAIDDVHRCVSIPRNEHLPEIIFTHVMQRIIYQIAVLRGLNPDKPRNLAKVVTVE